LLQQVVPAGLEPATGCLQQWHAVLARKCKLVGIRNVCGDARAFDERSMLRFDERGDQAQVVADRVAGGKFAQARRSGRENFGLAGKADAWDRSLGQCFDLAGLEDALQGWSLT
jgi:hypothetical protein